MITMEELYEEFTKRPVGSKFITASDRNTIELMESTYKIVLGRRGMKHGSNSLDIMIEVKKKDKFSGFFGQESGYIWHLENKEDLELLIKKIEKIPESITKDGPYDFSRRSTYIKKLGHPNPKAVACSGNFVQNATVNRVVVIDEKGKLITDLHTQGREAWFEINLGAIKGTNTAFNFNSFAPSNFASNGSFSIIYNTEKWWPVDIEKGRATSVLTFTEGKLLTMHDKFVLDLAIKAFNGG